MLDTTNYNQSQMSEYLGLEGVISSTLPVQRIEVSPYNLTELIKTSEAPKEISYQHLSSAELYALPNYKSKIAEIKSVIEAAFGQKLKDDYFEDIKGKETFYLATAKVDNGSDVIVGVGIVLETLQEHYLCKLAVKPDKKYKEGNNIGGNLLDNMLDNYDFIFLRTQDIPERETAIAKYKSYSNDEVPFNFEDMSFLAFFLGKKGLKPENVKTHYTEKKQAECIEYMKKPSSFIEPSQ